MESPRDPLPAGLSAAPAAPDSPPADAASTEPVPVVPRPREPSGPAASRPGPAGHGSGGSGGPVEAMPPSDAVSWVPQVPRAALVHGAPRLRAPRPRARQAQRFPVPRLPVPRFPVPGLLVPRSPRRGRPCPPGRRTVSRLCPARGRPPRRPASRQGRPPGRPVRLPRPRGGSAHSSGCGSTRWARCRRAPRGSWRSRDEHRFRARWPRPPRPAACCRWWHLTPGPGSPGRAASRTRARSAT
jgi:hypothetical protein